MSPRRRRAVEVVLGSIALIAVVLSIMTAAGAVTLPILGIGSNGINDLGAIGQGLGQMPAKVATAKRAEPPFVATPVAPCGRGSRPEPSVDGRVPSGTGVNGLWCNISEVSHQGTSGGFKVLRYVDTKGHVCAFYDTALLFPTNAINAAGPSLGVAVLDMDDPAHPVQTDTLTQVPMMTPHESLNLNTKRGLLAAVNGNPSTEPGLVSIYDAHSDCRHPALDSTTLVARFGHESGFSSDGKTFYATSTALPSITAVDVTDPKHPTAIWEGNIYAHGMTLSDDGNRAYIADPNGGDMLILDTSQIQARVPNPQATEISRLTWTSASIPQNAIPFTENGHPYVLEFDEYTQATLNPTGDSNAVGAARIIDISDETKPFVVANLRLQVDQPADHQAASGDPGTLSPAQGYAAHYCNIPTRVNPKIVACSFIASGLRVFDISHLTQPKEIGYFVSPTTPNTETGYSESDYAMSQPAFDTARHDIWYTDGGTGFYVLHVDDGVWPTDAAPKAHGGCPAAAGGASGRSLGPVTLGMTRGGVRRACARANGIRVAYVHGRVAAAVTSNRHYSLDGVTPGTRLARAAKLVKFGRGVRIGKNTWYLPSAGRSRGLLEARHGVVERVGIAEKSPTAGRARARRLLKRLR